MRRWADGTQVLARPHPKVREIEQTAFDLADIKGQESAKRALEVAAAGGNNKTPMPVSIFAPGICAKRTTAFPSFEKCQAHELALSVACRQVEVRTVSPRTIMR